MTGPRDRSDLVLLIAAILAGAFFFFSLDALWPLATVDVTREPAGVEAEARTFLRARGVSIDGAEAAARLHVDERLLDYLQRSFGLDETRALIRRLPVYRYIVVAKQRGNPDVAFVAVDPAGGIIGWGRTLQEDAPGARLEADAALALARTAASHLGIDTSDWDSRGVSTTERPERRDHYFTWERTISTEPELRERLWVEVAGEVATADRRLVVPDSAVRDARRRAAPNSALFVAGALGAAFAGLVALALFLTHLRRGTVALRPAAILVGIVALSFLTIQALRPADLLQQWDPLWPRWIATFQSLALSAAGGAWIAFILFVVIAAGDALDRESGARRGASLWLAAAGKLTDPAVGRASLRGFLVGLLSGAALSAAVLLLERFAGGWTPIQPQGFFFYAINSSAPAISTLVFFLMVALVEELGYRFFAGTWLLGATGRAWIAILIPAMLYGATHTGLGFLPPAEPFWGRAVALTAVGCVWGWAFLRYDALTVVLSHFTADLFIFNWPRLESGDPDLILRAIATIAVPLIPGVLWLLSTSRGGRGSFRGRKGGRSREMTGLAAEESQNA
ncbi:MAG TPA: CPBP family intramembrane glutamic endopeptidase [Thermoanaerobaculia bacterium]|nr:CPBP family intramembrane glutamic endopeptidase [Thermoanaerobaculia bacterium]